MTNAVEKINDFVAVRQLLFGFDIIVFSSSSDGITRLSRNCEDQQNHIRISYKGHITDDEVYSVISKSLVFLKTS